MKKFLLLLLLTSAFHFSVFAQNPEKINVMTLGTFHFDFPNNDVQKIENGDQIDVFRDQHQQQINTLVDQLSDFNPTIIAIERKPGRQADIDSLYRQYVNGNHKLERSEDQQIGFRLAKLLKLNKVHAVDVWGQMYEKVNRGFKDSVKAAEFEHFYFNNPDTSKKYNGGESVFAQQGILAEIIRLNQPSHLKKSLGNYLIGHFKFEYRENDYFGTDFETGRWFNRNLRIFRNIQRIDANEDDRILMVFGAGHMNLLNILFKVSPEYSLISPLEYLKE